MKKLVIVMLAVAAMSTAYASKVKWGNAGLPDTWTTTGGATMYLIYDGLTSAGNGLPDTSTWSTKSSFSLADALGTTGSSTTYTHALTAADSYTYADSVGTGTLHPVDLDGTGAANASRKFYMVILSDDGKQIALSTLKTATITSADTSAVNLIWTSSGNFTVYTASSVPEPTSGLLLLLGGAMLALRRRRA